MITQEQYNKVEELIDNILDNKPVKKDSEYNSTINNARQLERDLMESVKKGNFTMVYQPKFYDGKSTVEAEALFRTNESIKIRPDVAFTLFKLFGDEKEVVMKQLEVIAKDSTKFKDKIDPNYTVSMNVALSCIDDEFIEKLDKVVKKNGLKYSNIGIEILESEDFGNFEKHIKKLEILQKKGIAFSLDDFGSRNATEDALDVMNFDVIKIDAGYLKRARANNDYSEITALEHKITEKHPNSMIVVEGVETPEDVENLDKVGIHQMYQGYKFSKPLPANELVEKYANQEYQPGNE